MNELIIKDDLCPRLSPEERTIILASRESKVKELKPIEVANKISELVTIALITLGHAKNEFPDRSIVEKAIVKDILTSFTTLTLKEIENAFYMGARGSFKNKPDDFVFLSISTVYTWLVKYQIDIRREAMKKQIQYYKEQDIINKDEKIKEARELNIKSLKEEYDKFLNGHPIYDPLNVLYNFLDSEGFVNLSISRKNEIYQRVKEKYKHAHSKSNSKFEHNQNKKILQEIEHGTDKVKAIYKMMAKYEALTIVFQDLKDLGMTMDEFLNK